ATTSAPSAPQAPKRLTIAIGGIPPGLHIALNQGSTSVPGLAETITLVNPRLTAVNAAGDRVPVLGANVPSTTEGTWTVQPDGRMPTTAKLKPGIPWHE